MRNKKAPTLAHWRVAAAPEGPLIALGRPSGNKKGEVPSHSALGCISRKDQAISCPRPSCD